MKTLVFSLLYASERGSEGSLSGKGRKFEFEWKARKFEKVGYMDRVWGF